MFHMIWHCNKLLATKAEHCSTQIYREYLCTTHTFTSHKVAHSHFITGNIETLHWKTELPAEAIAFLWCMLSKHTICFHNIPGRSAEVLPLPELQKCILIFEGEKKGTRGSVSNRIVCPDHLNSMPSAWCSGKSTGRSSAKCSAKQTAPRGK